MEPSSTKRPKLDSMTNENVIKVWIRRDKAGSEPTLIRMPPSTYVSDLKKEAHKEFRIDEHIPPVDCWIVKEDGIKVETGVEVEMLQQENCATFKNPLILKVPIGPQPPAHQQLSIQFNDPLCLEIPTYVERSFASLKDLSAEMEKTATVNFFLGPPGTGKTTTLKSLYNHMLSMDRDRKHLYVDAKYHEISDLPGSMEDAYVFIDNAQCLIEKRRLCLYLKRGRSFCLAFSPVIIDVNGSSTYKCGFDYTIKTFFRPFSKEELAEYAKHVTISATVLKKIQEYDTVIPRMIFQCKDAPSDHIDRWLHGRVHSLLLELTNLLSTVADVDKRNILEFHSLIMKSTLGESLDDEDTPMAETCGLFYEDGSEFKLVFPVDIVLKQLHSHVLRNYRLFKTYDIGAAFEFLVSAQLRMQKNVVVCYGENPSPLHATLGSKDGNSLEQYIIEIPASYQIQKTAEDALQSGGTVLIKLYEQHPCIDFLVIEKVAGRSSEKLFLIQSSVTRYQNRSGPKLEEVYEKTLASTNNASVLNFYSTKTGIPKKQCFFVYACTEITESATFTKSPNVSNKVYFLKICAA